MDRPQLVTYQGALELHDRCLPELYTMLGRWEWLPRPHGTAQPDALADGEDIEKYLPLPALHVRGAENLRAEGRRKFPGHVFISYVREDSRRVDQLQQMLEGAGVPVWRDTTDLWPGEDWRANIRHAITDNALIFVACFSLASLARGRSYQNEELVLAIEQLRMRPADDPWLIPVRFDECNVPDRDIGGGRSLASIQCADLFGERSVEGADRLVTSIRRILGRRSDIAGPPTTADRNDFGKDS